MSEPEPQRPPATFIREIEPIPRKERAMAQGKAGTGTRCGYCKSTDHRSTKDCPKYQAYRKRKEAGEPTAGHRKRKPITRRTQKPRASGSSAAAAIREEILACEAKLDALNKALAVLGES